MGQPCLPLEGRGCYGLRPEQPWLRKPEEGHFSTVYSSEGDSRERYDCGSVAKGVRGNGILEREAEVVFPKENLREWGRSNGAVQKQRYLENKGSSRIWLFLGKMVVDNVSDTAVYQEIGGLYECCLLYHSGCGSSMECAMGCCRL